MQDLSGAHDGPSRLRATSPRYVLPEIVDSSERYLLDDAATYESAARSDGRSIFHDAEGASRARSTVHRWIGFLGSLVLLLGNATDLLRQADPAYSPLAEMRPISPRRYRANFVASSSNVPTDCFVFAFV